MWVSQEIVGPPILGAASSYPSKTLRTGVYRCCSPGPNLQPLQSPSLDSMTSRCHGRWLPSKNWSLVGYIRILFFFVFFPHQAKSQAISQPFTNISQKSGKFPLGPIPSYPSYPSHPSNPHLPVEAVNGHQAGLAAGGAMFQGDLMRIQSPVPKDQAPITWISERWFGWNGEIQMPWGNPGENRESPTVWGVCSDQRWKSDLTFFEFGFWRQQPET